MRSLRWRLTLWYALSVLGVLTVFVGITRFHLRHELQREKWERAKPGQGEFVLHGNYSDPEIDDIVGELTVLAVYYALPVAILALGIGAYLSRRAFQPVAEMNRQLQAIGARSLDQRITANHTDVEFRQIEESINALLGRLDASFRQLTEFSAQVAHELRTPLTLLRLQVEEAAGHIEPALAESLQEELRRLSDYVDQCLLLATAEQKRLTLQVGPVPLRGLLAEMLETYELLAREQVRSLAVVAPEEILVQADVRCLRQILHNLFTNALRHGKDEITVTVARDGAEVVCRFENAVNRQAAAALPGTGLGLRIVRALAALHPQLDFRAAETAGRYAAELRWR